MAHEGGYYRFFAYFNLFMFFMLVLVLAANFLLMFVGWEGVGLCSYLLIGFYFQEKFATDAGNKAFIVNRIGDFGFSLAVFLIAIHFGSLDFGKVFSQAKDLPVESSPGWITAICLLLLVGAAGKSAQIPLYVWLPDAMAGPTPVSALIHAATMVTAGVYMIARSSPIYLALGVRAGYRGHRRFDHGVFRRHHRPGAERYQESLRLLHGFAARLHVPGPRHRGFLRRNLSFNDARVFQGAAVPGRGQRDSRAFGRTGSAQDGRTLRRRFPSPAATLFCAGVAIAGVPPFSGFHSKDAILAAAYQHAPWMYWVGVFTAFMTAFYVFRALFMCFFGEYRGDQHHPHESPPVMWVPLAVLAVLSLAGGYINIPRFLEPMFPLGEEGGNEWTVYVSVAAGVARHRAGVSFLRRRAVDSRIACRHVPRRSTL